jgi:hypothetical protein
VEQPTDSPEPSPSTAQSRTDDDETAGNDETAGDSSSESEVRMVMQECVVCLALLETSLSFSRY